ncbi:NADH-quinone oxidoreductase subunit J [Nocardioides bruguierae]|uniref:NADH-quinone oxidoreductase subunit J n=1 Tax=Nocardioides bruguierae TaxID=2945102 RepID=A0A9X2IG83_9ACTN|nr:NADH-quinone oxidoreductase subunit J [Nocardioides bruguierae]MCL8023796.1 NADH-quinone oxidoreductase subunit J [Nocardioides bruguierae]MCM0621758.1 NADH-quinone oxidoreductase subunit J [Nocardioides bruguierae]
MSVAFWVLAVVVTAAALGVLFVRNAVHAALLLAAVMIGLAGLYLTLEAPFLFAVQIIVYTGAVMMLFLFVVMLVGVDASDSLTETIPGQRALSILGGVVLGSLLVVGTAQISLGAATGMGAVNSDGNIQAIAALLFSRYVLAFEVTAALLITASLGAMVLAHRERLEPRTTQADLAAQRLRDYAETGKPLGPLPSPGVYARHNAVDTPALLPDGTPAPTSVSATLVARGTVRTASVSDVEATLAEITGGESAPAGGATGATDASAGSGHNTENPEVHPSTTDGEGGDR